MVNKINARQRRAKRARMKIRELGVPRLSVHRSLRHTYAYVCVDGGARIIASASTLEAKQSEAPPVGDKVEAARAVGRRVAQRAIEAGIERVAFDRSGYKYHGRVRAVAETAREAGLEF